MEQFIHELWIARWALAQGLLLTVEISLASIICGTIIGLFAGIGLTYGRWPLRLPIRAFVDCIRGIPVLVLILASFYLLTFAGINLTAIESGLFALSVFCGAHMGEIIRGALQSIPRTQIDAGRAIGLTFPKILAYVLLPQAARQIIPVWINTGAELVKASTLLSVIGTGELLLRTQEVVGRNFMTLEFYGLCGLLYFLVNYMIERFGKFASQRFALQ
jgi:polar amino acid transport system permease protein